MRLSNSNEPEQQVNEEEDEILWEVSTPKLFASGSSSGNSNNDVIWVPNPWAQMQDMEGEQGSDMPVVTVDSSPHLSTPHSNTPHSNTPHSNTPHSNTPHSNTPHSNTPRSHTEDCIRDVWAQNLEEEFCTLRQIIQHYPYVAMDTEFPGVVARPIGEFSSTSEYQYQLLRCNVDLLRIIQLGLTFLDENGKPPEGTTTWQFNFKFNLLTDMYAQDSIDLLQNCGIQFQKHEEDGIEPAMFAELLMTSGIVLMDDVKWLSFHSGYDFGYLIKMLTNCNLPTDEAEFFDLLKMYFPHIYDIKHLMKSCKSLKGGLQEVSEQLDIVRIGPQHQAGSDSLLTGMAFFKMKAVFFNDAIDEAKFSGHLYGLGSSYVVKRNADHYGTDNGENSNSS